MGLGNTLNILRPPALATRPVQTQWNEDLVKNMHDVLGRLQQQISETSVVSTASLTNYATKAILEATIIGVIVTSVQLTGYAADGDGGGALYVRVVAEPSHALKIQSLDGAWWEIVPDASGFINVLQAGVVMNSRAAASANTTALQAVIDAAADLGVKLDLTFGSLFVDGRITLNATVYIVGRGNTRWPHNSAARRSTTTDTALPSPSQIVFTGTGTRDLTVLGISSMRNCGGDQRNLSTQSGYNDDTYRLLSFVDDSATTTRTQRLISVAWHVQTAAHGSIFRDFRIVLDAGGDDGLDGYFGVVAASVAWGDGNSNWDIGVYNDTTPGLIFNDFQVIGPWQMAGYLLTITPSDGDFSTMTFNLAPYDCVHNNCVYEGYKAISIRGSDTFQIVALTSTTVSVPWADDHPFAESGSMFLATNQNATTEFTYTGITKVGATGGNPDLLRFDGLVDNPDTSFDPGNNVIPYNVGASSGIKFEQCRFGGMHHPSGFPCHYASLGAPMDNPGGGIEISGRLIVEITFTDWQIQHNEQMGIHMHQCREIYFSESGQAEGNRPIGITEAGLRFIASPHHTLTTGEVLLSLVVAGGGTGYSVDDILTVTGGTFTTVAKIRVDSVSGGVIQTASVLLPGMYSVTPSNDVAVTDSGNSDATFTLTWVEQYTSGDTFNIYIGTGDMILGDANDFRPKIPLHDVGRWSNADDNGFFNPNFVRVPEWALRSDTDQGTGVVAPVGGKVGLIKSTAPTSGNRVPTSHDPDYAMYYDDTSDFFKFGGTTNVPDEKFHFAASGSATNTNGIRLTGFRPHLTLEDASGSGSATDFQLWVDGNELKFLHGLTSSNDKLSNTLLTLLANVFKPGADDTVALGTAAARWKHVYADEFRPGTGTPIWTSGSGSPESSLTAVVGSLYTDTSGGAATTLYVKESGTGNTGWVASFGSVVASIEDLVAGDYTSFPDGESIEVSSYHPLITTSAIDGGGRFVWDATRAKSEHDGGIYISPTVPWTWADDGDDFLGAVGETDGAGTGVFVRVTDNELLPEHFGARTGASIDSAASLKAVFARMLATQTNFSSVSGRGHRYGVSVPLITQSGASVFGKTIKDIGIIALSGFTGDHLFQFAGDGTVSSVTDLHFSHCYLVGGPTSGVAYVKKLIDLDEVSGCWIDQCELRFFTEHGILSRGTQAATELFIHDCRITGNVGDNTACIGIEIAGNDSGVEQNLIRSCFTHCYFLGRGNVFNGNHIYNTGSDRDTYGLIYDDAKTMLINNNYFDNVRIRLDDPKGLTMTGNKFLLQNGTEWTGVKAFVVFKATAADTVLENCTITGNVFKQTSGTALDAFDVDESAFTFDYANMAQMFIKDNVFERFAVQTTHPSVRINFPTAASRTADLATFNPFGTNSVYKYARSAVWQDIGTGTGEVKRTAISANVLTVVMLGNPTGDILATATVNTDGE